MSCLQGLVEKGATPSPKPCPSGSPTRWPSASTSPAWTEASHRSAGPSESRAQLLCYHPARASRLQEDLRAQRQTAGVTRGCHTQRPLIRLLVHQTEGRAPGGWQPDHGKGKWQPDARLVNCQLFKTDLCFC